MSYISGRQSDSCKYTITIVGSEPYNAFQAMAAEQIDAAARNDEKPDSIFTQIQDVAKPVIRFRDLEEIEFVVKSLERFAEDTDYMTLQLQVSAPEQIVHSLALERTNMGRVAADVASQLSKQWAVEETIAAAPLGFKMSDPDIWLRSL